VDSARPTRWRRDKSAKIGDGTNIESGVFEPPQKTLGVLDAGWPLDRKHPHIVEFDCCFREDSAARLQYRHGSPVFYIGPPTDKRG